MQVIGVVDLLGGLAVHARAGRRESYAPVTTIGGSRIEPGDALAVARAYVDRLGRTEDAGRSSQGTVVAAVAALGAPLWLDAGVSTADHAHRAFALGAAHVV